VKHRELKKLQKAIATCFEYLEIKHNNNELDENNLPKFIQRGKRKPQPKSQPRLNVGSKSRNKKPPRRTKQRGQNMYSDSDSESESEGYMNLDYDDDNSGERRSKIINIKYKPHKGDDHQQFAEGFVRFWYQFCVLLGKKLRKSKLLSEATRRAKQLLYLIAEFEVFQVPATMMANKLVSPITNSMNERGLGRISNIVIPVRNKMSAQALNQHDIIHHDTLSKYCVSKLDKKNVSIATFCVKVIYALNWTDPLKDTLNKCLQTIRDQRILLS